MVLNWHEKLKNCKDRNERFDLISNDECPIEILHIAINYDTETKIIEAGINHKNCSDELKKIGKNRIKKIQTSSANNSTLCPIPWNHLSIQQNGDLRQCCQMIDSPFGRFLTDEKALKFSDENINKARNHEVAKQLRHEMMNNKKPSLCELCWKEENVGISSKRVHMLNEYDMTSFLENTESDGTINIDNIPLSYLDLRLGNLCNLKCRSCGPGDSSLWLNDYVALSNKTDNISMPYFNNQEYNIIKSNKGWEIDSNDFDWHHDETFHAWLENKISNGLDRIYFTGGEPTINKNHLKILEKLIETNKAKDFILEYNTNLVAIPPILIKYWREFKKVNIGASIDAIGPLAKYVRYPSNWDIIEKNCDKLCYSQLPQISVGITTTISILNVRHLPDMTKWLINKNYTSCGKYPSWHLLHNPPYFNIQILPDEIKSIIEEEYNQFYKWTENNMNKIDSLELQADYSKIIKFMNQDSKVSELPKFKKFNYQLDEVRGESLSISIPWLYEIVEKY